MRMSHFYSLGDDDSDGSSVGSVGSIMSTFSTMSKMKRAKEKKKKKKSKSKDGVYETEIYCTCECTRHTRAIHVERSAYRFKNPCFSRM